MVHSAEATASARAPKIQAMAFGRRSDHPPRPDLQLEQLLHSLSASGCSRATHCAYRALIVVPWMPTRGGESHPAVPSGWLSGRHDLWLGPYRWDARIRWRSEKHQSGWIDRPLPRGVDLDDRSPSSYGQFAVPMLMMMRRRDSRAFVRQGDCCSWPAPPRLQE